MRLPGFALLLLCLTTLSARSEEVRSVPPPDSGTWARDTTHTLSPAALEEIARLGTEVNEQRLGQLGVAVVSTTGGRNSREFATALFNAWGIGRSGEDDGVLLFVALKDHKAEIILGKGLAGEQTRARSDALMANGIVPAFKAGHPEQAILVGARGLQNLLLLSQGSSGRASSPTPVPDTAPVASPPPVSSTTAESDLSTPPPPESSSFPWRMGMGAGVALLGGLGLRAWSRRAPRCETCGQPLTELAEPERAAHLSEGEESEERLGSVHYRLLRCVPCGGPVDKRGTAATFDLHVKCPACRFKTATTSAQVTRQPTYTSEGERQTTSACTHCGHREVSTAFIAMLVESSSSSDSSSGSSSDSSSGSSSDSSSSSSDSSSSSSSDYGGGSSSGDGSSGSW